LDLAEGSVGLGLVPHQLNSSSRRPADSRQSRLTPLQRDFRHRLKGNWSRQGGKGIMRPVTISPSRIDGPEAIVVSTT